MLAITVNSKTRQRLSTPCFINNPGEVNLYREVFTMQIYNAVNLVFSYLLAPDGGDLSTEVYVRIFFETGLNILCVPETAFPFRRPFC